MTSALLIIDVQEGLFTPPPADAAGTVARINQLSERARRAGVPVVVIQHHTPDDELPHGSAAASARGAEGGAGRSSGG